jgi:GH43 family beta-xylosidase
MQDVNLNNYIIDRDSDPVKIVDISSNAIRNNSMLHKLDTTLWNPERLVTLIFNKETRKLKINVRTFLPSMRKIWVVPKGNYMLSLAQIDLQSKQEIEYHIKEYKKINSCEIITEDDVNVFMAYKEIENEADLSN